MDFGACVDVSDEEDPRAICECQVILFSQGVIFTMSDFHTFEVFFFKNVQKLKIGNNENSDGSDI